MSTFARQARSIGYYLQKKFPELGEYVDDYMALQEGHVYFYCKDTRMVDTIKIHFIERGWYALGLINDVYHHYNYEYSNLENDTINITINQDKLWQIIDFAYDVIEPYKEVSNV